jgi:ATP-binding protein involved in chromosome partitioning
MGEANSTHGEQAGAVDRSEYRYGTIQKIVGIVSGKGGVGKSAVTGLLAAAMAHQGHAVGILDADITGPSIPRMFGIHKKAQTAGPVIIPAVSVEKIKIMSINLLLEKEDDPVIWRGPLVAGVVKQFFTDVDWGDLDYLFVDLPPGTGDVPLTVMQSLPIDGVVIVATPQELVGMIVKKAIHMAEMMNVPVLGIIGNMSHVVCPDCNKKIQLFGPNGMDAIVAETGVKLLGNLPLLPDLALLGDEGKIELVDHLYPDFFAETRDAFAQALAAQGEKTAEEADRK